MLSVAFITFYFSISSEFMVIDLIYAAFFHLCLVPLIYLLLRVITPLFLEKERYVFFLAIAIVNIILAIGIHELVFEWVIPKLLKGYFIVSFTNYSSLFLLFSVYSIIALLLHLSKKSFRVRELERENLSLELRSLKNQLNPHFLFNALNSVYSLSLKKDDNAPAVILRLSELLRFILDEVSENYIALSKEVDMINKYIDLQKIRLEQPDKVNLSIKGQGSPKIAPMMLFTLVENAFKHADLSSHDSFVKIRLLYQETQLFFSVSNTYNEGIKEPHPPGGIGLENLRKRIELIYGDKGKVKIEQKDEVFTAELTLGFT
jgi:LytS/YehU family sensor histidine kinase